jgi:toluene monooxygenase electron transfer component
MMVCGNYSWRVDRHDASGTMREPFKISIAGTDATYSCAADDVLLRAGLRAGLGMPYECNVGGCGTCKIEVLEGDTDVIWTDAPSLTDRDRARNRQLGCQTRPKSDCVLRLRLGTNYVPPVKAVRTGAELLGWKDLTHDIREFQFRLDVPADFLPGQYSLFSLPSVAGVRAYSMSNVFDGSHWEFQIRRVPGGAGTSLLFDRLKRGDRLTLDGPYGGAYLRENSNRDVVCIAGGSGLAPTIAVARGMAARGMLQDRNLWFFFGGRGPHDIVGENLLRELAGFGTRIKYSAAISMAELDIHRTWLGPVGMVHELVRDVLADRLTECEIYFAGPGAMVEAVLGLAMEAKVPTQQLHYDRYY